MRRLRLICLFSLLLLGIGALRANAASVEKARELAEMLGARKMMADIVPTIIDSMMKNIRSNPNMPSDLPDIISTTVNDTLVPLIPQMYEAAVKVYADNLTDDDIASVIEFYKTPAGQHYLQKLPAMMQQNIRNAQSIVAVHMPEIQQRVVLEIKQRHPEKK
jgi:hypothetical protein